MRANDEDFDYETSEVNESSEYTPEKSSSVSSAFCQMPIATSTDNHQ